MEIHPLLGNAVHASSRTDSTESARVNGWTAKGETMNEPNEFKKRERKHRTPKEYKLVALRDCPMPVDLMVCDTPARLVSYWRTHIETSPTFNPDVEHMAVILLNARYRAKGHYLAGVGTLDQVSVHPREVFRIAIVAASHSVVLAHNHPSGDPLPSEADIRITREMIRAGRLIRIEVLDHVVVGKQAHVSLRELGYFQA